MGGYTATFARTEKKYLLSGSQYAVLEPALETKLEPDEYGETRIASLYYDTPARDLIARSIEKPLYKEKLRIRSYGEAQPSAPVFVELKKKYDGIVYKRRVRVSAAAAEAYLEGEPLAESEREHPLARPGRHAVQEKPSTDTYQGVQVARELAGFFARHDVGPSMMIAYRRTAWKPLPAATDAEGLRITFDRRIAYRDCAGEPSSRLVELLNAFTPCKLIDDGCVLMEVKCAGAYPLWLARAFTEVEAFPCSFTKYGSAYQMRERERHAHMVRARDGFPGRR